MPAPADETPQVWEIVGEPMAFFVASRSKPKEPHRVELLNHNGAGECSCVDWQARRWVAIRDGAPIGTKATTCRHVRAARQYFLNDLLRRMAQQQPTDPNQPI